MAQRTRRRVSLVKFKQDTDSSLGFGVVFAYSVRLTVIKCAGRIKNGRLERKRKWH